MVSKNLEYKKHTSETDDNISHQGKNVMIGCRYCKISSCPIHDKSECPFNRLWEESVINEQLKLKLDDLLHAFENSLESSLLPVIILNESRYLLTC